MGDHVLDRSTSATVRGEFVFFFWPYFGLVSVALQFEAVLGDVLRPSLISNLAETNKRSYSTRPKKSHSAIRRNTEPVSRKALSIQDHLTET